MTFKTLGNKTNPAILFFHAMGVTGASSKPVAEYLKEKFYCILPTASVYCEGQKYISKKDEVRQVEEFLHNQNINVLSLLLHRQLEQTLQLHFFLRQVFLSCTFSLMAVNLLKLVNLRAA